MEDLKIPVVPKDIVDYLEETFNVDNLLIVKKGNGDEHLGFIRGVREVIIRLKHLSNKED